MFRKFKKKLDEKQRKNKGMTSEISSLVRIWKISHLYPGCSFVWKIRVVHFSVKHSYLYNKSQFHVLMLDFVFELTFTFTTPNMVHDVRVAAMLGKKCSNSSLLDPFFLLLFRKMFNKANTSSIFGVRPGKDVALDRSKRP
mgnify:CR=1 FL=1